MRSFHHRVLSCMRSRHSGNAECDYVVSRVTVCSMDAEFLFSEFLFSDLPTEIDASGDLLPVRLPVLEEHKFRVGNVPDLKPAIVKLDPELVDIENAYAKMKSCCSTKSLETFHCASSKSDDEDGESSQASTVSATQPSITSVNSHLDDMPLAARVVRKCSTSMIYSTDTSGMTRHYSNPPHQVHHIRKIEHIEDHFCKCRHQLTNLVGKGRLGSAPEYLKLCDELVSMCAEVLDISCRRDVPGAMDLYEELGSLLEDVVSSMDINCGSKIAALPAPMKTVQNKDEGFKPESGCVGGVSIMFQCFAGVFAGMRYRPWVVALHGFADARILGRSEISLSSTIPTIQ